MSDAATKASLIKLMVFDIDGVFTDGGLYYSNSGEELKAFNVQDGVGIKLLHSSGIKTAIITGRSSSIVSNRAKELGIETVLQGRDDKFEACVEVSNMLNLGMSSISYMGDDLPDIKAVKAAGLGIAVNNASKHLKKHADFETSTKGGYGAVREACEFVLSSQGKLTKALQPFLE